jgi:DNA-binding LacI/PurR family transcriptional regulator
MGILAASALLRRLGNVASEAQTVTVEPKLIVRGSTAPPG